MSGMASTAPKPSVTRRRLLARRFVSNRAARWIRLTARAWILIATAIFLGFALNGQMPFNPNVGTWQQMAQLGILLFIAVGAVLALRWEWLGASIIVIGAIVLGVLATLVHSPLNALPVTLIFLIPGVLLWFIWQRRQPLRAVVALALGMTLLLASGGYAASYFYDQFFGSNAPRSSLTALPVTLVDWIWSGATTDSSITVKARLVRDSDAVRLVVSRSPDLSNPIYSAPTTARRANGNGVVAFTMTGLLPDTQYYYAVQADDELDRSRLGQFRTFAAGPFSFQFAFGSCVLTGSNSSVFETIKEMDPLFFLEYGDLFYGEITANDPTAFRAMYQYPLTSPAQSALYRSVPIAYVWDDHDYGANDSDRTSPSRDAAHQVYREVAPHYPLAPQATAPIYQAFTVGRVRFIITDTRSARSPKTDPDNADKTMLGSEQKAWFKQQLLEAKGKYPVIVWVNSLPWIDSAGAGKDTWGGYSTERRELADFIAANQIDGLVMLSGDAHLVAIDDGSNSDYSTKGGGGFVVMQAAALDNRGSIKGGPYSEGVHLGGGQFGMMRVTDDGGATVTVSLGGYNWTGTEFVSYRFTVPAAPK